MFRDRVHAGGELAKALAHMASKRPIVTALPPGGVLVAFEVAMALEAPLDLAMVCSVADPTDPELAIGAVVGGRTPEVHLEREKIAAAGLAEASVQAAVLEAKRELARRERTYLRPAAGISVRDRTVIVVDDGVASPITVRAVLRSLQARRPKRTVFAVPVAPSETLAELRRLGSEVVCLSEPSAFRAAGPFYEHFERVTDEQALGLLVLAKRVMRARDGTVAG